MCFVQCIQLSGNHQHILYEMPITLSSTALEMRSCIAGESNSSIYSIECVVEYNGNPVEFVVFGNRYTYMS